jgi:hypothetical protein
MLERETLCDGLGLGVGRALLYRAVRSRLPSGATCLARPPRHCVPVPAHSRAARQQHAAGPSPSRQRAHVVPPPLALTSLCSNHAARASGPTALQRSLQGLSAPRRACLKLSPARSPMRPTIHARPLHRFADSFHASKALRASRGRVPVYPRSASRQSVRLLGPPRTVRGRTSLPSAWPLDFAGQARSRAACAAEETAADHDDRRLSAGCPSRGTVLGGPRSRLTALSRTRSRTSYRSGTRHALAAHSAKGNSATPPEPTPDRNDIGSGFREARESIASPCESPHDVAQEPRADRPDAARRIDRL